MKAAIIKYALRMLLSVLTPELINEFMRNTIEFTRNRVLGTASTVDDQLVLPVLDIIEKALGLEDES